MDLARLALRNRAVTYFTAVLLTLGGLYSFFALGQLEDPEFSIKDASIVTLYPGASPIEVEEEVTNRIELALQEIPEIAHLDSTSRAGLSIVEVTVKPEYWADRLPQIWDTLRRKIRDVQEALPPGSGRPEIYDDLGDVFGFQLALTGDGFDYSEIERYAKEIRKSLSLVEGVARVDLWGVQQKILYVDTSQTQLAELGVTEENIAATLELQNAVVDPGSVDLNQRRLRLALTGAFQSPLDIANLPIVATAAEEYAAGHPAASGSVIRIRDIGTVRSGYLDPPNDVMRFNGETAIGISISNEPGVNIVGVGEALDAELAALEAGLPVGIEIEKVHWQSEVVNEAVDGFLLSFVEALAIVIAVVALFMGWRMGLVIGLALGFTILATFILMALIGIDLQRVSLGALVVALGMMVDNAIVVADGYLVRRQAGMESEAAAAEAARLPAWPLLGATVIAIMAFFPIYASSEDVGEYCQTLFTVIAISLLVSWIVSMTLTPLNCIDILKNAPAGTGAEPYSGRFFKGYRRVLETALSARWATVLAMVVLLAVSAFGFGHVRQLFFPDSSMTKFMVDYWAPEGTRIQTVSEGLRAAENHLLADPRVSGVATFIGSGPPRFYLPVTPELPNPSYAQLIVSVDNAAEIDAIVRDLQPWLEAGYPDALPVIRKFGVGPSNTWKLEARIVGPADADPDTLRAIAADVGEVLNAQPLIAQVRTDWRQRVQRIETGFNQERARWASVNRQDVAAAMKQAFDGRPVGLYREGNDLIPIVLRYSEDERRNVAAIDVLPVPQSGSTRTVPVAQVIDDVETVWEDPIIRRRDRLRTINIQANPVHGATAPEVFEKVASRIAELPLPAGYRLEWGGDHESSEDANASLVPGLMPALAAMALIVVALFNAFRPPIVIVLTIPFSFIGITGGLLLFDAPFGFMALLGAMSLSGMMVKNAIVLLDQINIEMADGQVRYEATIRAAMSRLRPVMLAAGTTVLGVIPLLQDVFWVGMAVTIIGGLTVGSLLTMLAVPLFYTMLYGLHKPAKSGAVMEGGLA